MGTKNGGFTIERITVGNVAKPYKTWRVKGYLRDQRIRRNFKERSEAAGFKQRMEIEAANASGEITTRSTSLSSDQLREAEAAFHQLKGQSLSLAVGYFLKNYREPKTDLILSVIQETFLAEKEREIKRVSYICYKHSINSFCREYGHLKPHEVTFRHVQHFMDTRTFEQVGPDGKKVTKKIGKKRWNNLRSDLNHFFNWCMDPIRAWIETNPVANIKKHKIAKGIPVTVDAATCMELMEFLEDYLDGRLIFYYALALFAGIRPSTRDGETVKMIAAYKERGLIKLDTGVILVPPDISKTKTLRQIIIQPNMRKWIELGLAKGGDVLPPNYEDRIAEIRRRFKLTPDVLRHTFATMHVGKFRSIGDTAMQSGNSEPIIKTHYLNMVSEAEANLFWEIYPRTDEDSRMASEEAHRLAAMIKRLAERVGTDNMRLQELEMVAKLFPHANSKLHDRLWKHRQVAHELGPGYEAIIGEKDEKKIEAYFAKVEEERKQREKEWEAGERRPVILTRHEGPRAEDFIK